MRHGAQHGRIQLNVTGNSFTHKHRTRCLLSTEKERRRKRKEKERRQEEMKEKREGKKQISPFKKLNLRKVRTNFGYRSPKVKPSTFCINV